MKALVAGIFIRFHISVIRVLLKVLESCMPAHKRSSIKQFICLSNSINKNIYLTFLLQYVFFSNYLAMEGKKSEMAGLCSEMKQCFIKYCNLKLFCKMKAGMYHWQACMVHVIQMQEYVTNYYYSFLWLKEIDFHRQDQMILTADQTK